MRVDGKENPVHRRGSGAFGVQGLSAKVHGSPKARTSQRKVLRVDPSGWNAGASESGHRRLHHLGGPTDVHVVVDKVRNEVTQRVGGEGFRMVGAGPEEIVDPVTLGPGDGIQLPTKYEVVGRRGAIQQRDVSGLTMEVFEEQSGRRDPDSAGDEQNLGRGSGSVREGAVGSFDNDLRSLRDLPDPRRIIAQRLDGHAERPVVDPRD